MAVQPAPAGAKGGAAAGGAPAPGAGPEPADPTGQIDANSAATQRFQNAGNARQTMWQAVMAIDEKGWKMLESIINDIKS